jgi:dipeptidyl aminopeptidase/acylaminoacyl peptidase
LEIGHRLATRLLLAIWALVAPGARGQDPPARLDVLTPELSLTLRQLSDLQFSPDGERLAFVVTEPPDSGGAGRHIWMLDVATRTARQFTHSPKSEWSPRWSPDGRRLAFVSDREDGSHLYIISMEGGEARAVTGGRLSPSGVAWSPDGTRIAFLARDTGSTADPRVVDHTDHRTRLWLLDVAGGTARPVTPAAWEVAELTWTPAGTTLVVAATDRPASDSVTASIWTLDLATDSLRAIATPHGFFTDLRVAPNGRTISYIGCRVDGPWPHDLITIPLTGGAARNRTADALDRLIEQYAWSADQSVVVRAASGFGTRLSRLSVVRPEAATLPIEGNVTTFAISRSGRLAFVREGATESPELYLRVGRSPPVAATHLNETWARVALVAPRRFSYRSFDRLEIDAQLLLPARSGGGPPPLVTLIHGGPTGRWSDAIDPLGQLLVQRGFAVFYPNVRGSVGYGERFIEANRADWGGGDFRDVMAGIDTLVARGLVDSARLGIGGWSYGGYLSAWAITQSRRFKAAVVGAGISDLLSEIGTEYSSWYDEWFNGWPAEHPERYLGRSPIRFAMNVRTPTLILHGEQDDIDPLGQGQELYRSLKHYGVTADFVVYPREAHHLHERNHALDRLTRILDWYERWIGTRSTNH